jgi:hypothetical protein
MRPLPVLAAVAAAASLVAAAPAGAATWSPPATVSAPHTFVSPLEAASSGNGTAVLHWGFQDGVGAGATAGVRGASLAPGATAFAPERALPATTTQLVPYAQRSIAALLRTNLDAAGRRVRLAVAFGSADVPSLGAARTVATDDVAFVPRLAVGADGSGLLAWVARTSGNRRVVKVSLRAPGGRFGAPSIISGTGRANGIVAAAGPQGDRVVAFERSGRLLARYRAAGHGWGSIQDLGAVAAGTANELAALISGGRATIADVHRQLSEGGTTGPLLVDAWVRPVGASRFGAVQRLEAGGDVESAPPVLVAVEGRGALLAWLGTDPASQATPGGPGRRVSASIMGANGRFGAPQALSAPAEAATALAGASSAGTAIVSWVRLAPTSDTSGQVLAAVRPAGGAFAPAEVVSPPENAFVTAPGFTRAADGHPFVAWASRPGGEGPGVPLAQIQTFVRVAQRQP